MYFLFPFPRINRKRKGLTQRRKENLQSIRNPKNAILYQRSPSPIIHSFLLLRLCVSKKLNQHSFFGNPFHPALAGLSGHCKKFLVLFAQNSIGNCLMVQYASVNTQDPTPQKGVNPNLRGPVLTESNWSLS